jgi:hypothetical protein
VPYPFAFCAKGWAGAGIAANVLQEGGWPPLFFSLPFSRMGCPSLRAFRSVGTTEIGTNNVTGLDLRVLFRYHKVSSSGP